MIAESPAAPSFLTRWDPRWKLFAFLVVVFVVAALQHLVTVLLALAAALWVWAGTGAKFKPVFLRLGAIALFFAPLFLLFSLQYEQNGQLVFSQSGWVLAWTILFRALTIMCFTSALLASTSIKGLLHAAQQLRLPRVFIQIALLTYRYLFTLTQEVNNIRNALAVRGVAARFSLRHWRILAHVIGMLIIRSFEKTERIQHAMQCRGYQGRIRSLHNFQSAASDVWLGLAALAGVIVLVGLDSLYFHG